MREGGREGMRKVRNDKKIDVKPTLSIELKEELYRFAYLSNDPVKDAAQRLCMNAVESPYIIDSILKWFRRDYHYLNKVVVGYPSRPRLKLITEKNVGKVTIKFPQDEYDLLTKLGYSLDITPTSTAAVLIRTTLSNRDFMDDYLQRNLAHLDTSKINEIKRLLKL